MCFLLTLNAIPHTWLCVKKNRNYTLNGGDVTMQGKYEGTVLLAFFIDLHVCIFPISMYFFVASSEVLGSNRRIPVMHEGFPMLPCGIRFYDM